MKNQVLLGVLVGAAAGFGGAVLGNLVSAPVPARDVAPVVGPRGASRESPAERDALTARLDELAMTTGELAARLTALEEGGPRRSEVTPAGEGATAAVDDDLAELATSLRTGRASGDFELLVESVLTSIAEREERQRELERDQRLQDQLEERLEELTERLGLSAYQVKELRPVLFEAEKKRQELFAEARETGNFRGLRESFREQREATLEVVGTILSPEQLEEYRSAERGFGRGGPGPRRGGSDEGRGG